MTVELPFEMEFILSLTYRCNLACNMCTQYGKGYKDQAEEEMTLEQWESFFESLSDVTPKPKMLLMGGEPLLYKAFDKLFLATQKHGFNVQIVTNGLLLDKHIELLSKYDIEITISIDGLHETHDMIRNKKGCFEKVIENIEKIQKLQKQGSKLKLCINYVMLPENIQDLVPFLIFIQKYNIYRITFQHLQSSTEELNQLTVVQWQDRLNQAYSNGLIPRKDYIIDKAYIDNLYQSISQLKDYCQIQGYVFPALDESEIFDYYLNQNLDKIRPNRICTTPWVNPTINPNGDVSNCIGNIIGNINQENFWDLWNNEKANNIRNSLVENGKFTLCSKCCNFYKCNFIVAPEGNLFTKDKILELPSEINFVKSSNSFVFVEDKTKIRTDDKIPVIPLEIFSELSLKKIKETENIIAYSNEIIGG